MGKANRFISNFIFIVTIFSMAYFGIAVYGITVLWYFFGKNELINYLYVISKNTTLLKEYRYCNIIRVCLGAGIIPAVILTSTHLNFNIFIHPLASILLFDGFDAENLIRIFLPFILLFYYKSMDYLQTKMGKVDFTDDTGIMFNDHYLIMTKIVNGLMIPFFGIILGRKVFKKIFHFCCYIYGYNSKQYNEDKYIKIWSFIGCLSYIIGCDLLCFYYLIMRKRKLKGMIVFERRNIFQKYSPNM
jgi:hypothetical protein